jgi:hypothetical protein
MMQPSESQDLTRRLNYGTDLWDRLDLVKDQSEARIKQIQGFKSFLKSYKKLIESFKDGMRKTLQAYDKEVLNVKKPQPSGIFPMLGSLKQQSAGSDFQGDQMTQSLIVCKSSLMEMVKKVEQLGDSVQKDIVDGIDVFERHYNA